MRQFASWLLIAAEGAVIGVAASHLSKMTKTADLIVDSTAGACGCLCVAWFVAPLSASGSLLGLPALLLGALGAAAFVCIAKLVRRP